MSGMRGGPRLMCSPYLTGALGIMVLLVGFNYWTVSTQNHDLLVNVDEMQQQLRVGSDRIGSQDDKLKDYFEKLAEAETKSIQLEEKNAKLEREVKQLKKDLKEKETNQINDKKEHDDELYRLTEEKEALQKEKDIVQEKAEKLEVENEALKSKIESVTDSLKAEADKAADLQSRLADLLSSNPHVAASAGGVEPAVDHQLGPGQLPDVDPHAVNVVKKDTLGGAGLHFDPVDQPDVAPVGKLNEQVNVVSSAPRGISSTSAVKKEEGVKQIPLPGMDDPESQEKAEKELSSGEVKEANVEDTGAKEDLDGEEDIKVNQGDNLDRKEADSDLNQKAENGMSNEDDIEDDQDPGGELNEVGDDKKPEEKKVEEYNMFN